MKSVRSDCCAGAEMKRTEALLRDVCLGAALGRRAGREGGAPRTVPEPRPIVEGRRDPPPSTPRPESADRQQTERRSAKQMARRLRGPGRRLSHVERLDPAQGPPGLSGRSESLIPRSCRSGSPSLPRATPRSTQRGIRDPPPRDQGCHPTRPDDPGRFRTQSQRDKSPVARPFKRAPPEPLFALTAFLSARALEDRQRSSATAAFCSCPAAARHRSNAHGSPPSRALPPWPAGQPVVHADYIPAIGRARTAAR